MKKLYYSNNRVKPRMLGLSLVSTMIFAFVLLITVSSLAYIFRYNRLSINSMLINDKTSKVQEQYLNKVKKSKKIALGSKTIGNYKFNNKLISKENIFSNKMVDITLYQAKPTALNENILHRAYFYGRLISKKNLSFNKPPKYSMINYGSKILPINVPFIAIERMNDNERLYHLKNNKILDNQAGYIGFIEKDYSWLLLSINDHVRIINLDNLDISKGNYDVKIGWHLYKGYWQLLMAVYDDTHIYIFKTNLEQLENDIDKSVLDLSIPISKITTIANIESLTWYFSKDNSLPSLAVTSPSKDSKENLSVRIYSIDYVPNEKKYISSLKDTLNGIGKYDFNTIHIRALDPDFILAKSSIVVTAGKRLIVYQVTKDNNDYSKFYMKLEDTSRGSPIIIKKDKYSYYVITYGKDRYYQYLYTKDTDILSKVKPKIYDDEEIFGIEVAYGFKFIITKENVYIDNFEGQQLTEISD